METKQTQYNNHSKGQVVILVTLFFIVISGAMISAVVIPTTNQMDVVKDSLSSRQSYIAAETVIDEAWYRLNTGRSLPSTISVPFSNNVVSSADVTTVGDTQEVVSTGNFRSAVRSLKSVFSPGNGAAFNYGLQLGNGGLTMSNTSKITGNVYANGNISGSNSAQITGTAIVSSAINSVPVRTNGTSTPASSIDIGKTGTAFTSVAQSFTIPTTAQIAKFSVYIKKSGAPTNLTLSVMTNSGSSPSNTQIGGSGTISASTVTTSYGWIDVYPTTAVNLTGGTTYWLRLTKSGTSATDYYTLGTTDGDSYTGKEVKTFSGSWASATPTGRDAYFSAYSGTTGSISGMTIGGNANAFTVNSSSVVGNLYCQAGSGNNKACNTTQAPSSPLGFPVSEANIDEWILEASGGQSRSAWSMSGSTASTTSGALKINGNLTLSNDAILTLGGPLYVTGNISLSNNAIIKLASTFGTTDEFVIVDGYVNTSNNGSFQGSGISGSYILLATKNGNININNNGGSVVIVTLNGTVTFANQASAKAVVADRMVMTNSSQLNYETGLTNVDFMGGPSGSWSTSSWQELAE